MALPSGLPAANFRFSRERYRACPTDRRSRQADGALPPLGVPLTLFSRGPSPSVVSASTPSPPLFGYGPSHFPSLVCFLVKDTRHHNRRQPGPAQLRISLLPYPGTTCREEERRSAAPSLLLGVCRVGGKGREVEGHLRCIGFGRPPWLRFNFATVYALGDTFLQRSVGWTVGFLNSRSAFS